MESLKNPVIDVKKIEEAAKAAAEKAYLSEVESYYNGYNSPFKKAIEEELKKQKFKWSLELPNILGHINQQLKEQIDIIANNAIANTYIPMVSDALIGYNKNITLSWLLEEIVQNLEPEYDDYEDFSFNYTKHHQHGWLNCELYTNNNNYEFTLHKAEENTYQLLSFPRNKYKSGHNCNMKVYKDGVTIEMPFTPGVLNDQVLTIFFKMMINNSHITMDCENFDDDMFPERDHCHC